MYRERKKTRDLLLEYDAAVLPPHPRAAGLKMIYPWENINNSILKNQIYQIAVDNGYVGVPEDFWSKFTTGLLIHGTITTFPVPGNEDNLYLDDETGILYYFKEVDTEVNTDMIARIGAAIVGQSRINGDEEKSIFLYIPVRAMPIEDLIYDCGDASDYIG
jgi:hypothetical protein